MQRPCGRDSQQPGAWEASVLSSEVRQVGHIRQAVM